MKSQHERAVKLNFVLICLVASTLLGSRLSLATDGSGSHGGDGVYFTFDKARKGLEQVFKNLNVGHIEQIKDVSVRDWVLENRAQLAEDIAESKHEWLSEEQI